jgi:hypothetical protein
MSNTEYVEYGDSIIVNDGTYEDLNKEIEDYKDRARRSGVLSYEDIENHIKVLKARKKECQNQNALVNYISRSLKSHQHVTRR